MTHIESALLSAIWAHINDRGYCAGLIESGGNEKTESEYVF